VQEHQGPANQIDKHTIKMAIWILR